MEIKEVEGFVLNEKNYGETSKILTVFTKEFGTICLLSKGCKKVKSDLKAVSQKFTYAKFQINYKKDKLSILINGDIVNPLFNIKTNIEKISYLNYISELTYQVIKQSSYKGIYNLFISTILKINEDFDPLVITNILELKFLDYLGVSPVFNGCAVCGNENVITLSSYKGGYVCKNHYNSEYIVESKTIRMIKALKYVDVSKITKIDMGDKVKKEINNFIDEYYDRYTGLYLNSKNFLKDIVKIV